MEGFEDQENDNSSYLPNEDDEGQDAFAADYFEDSNVYCVVLQSQQRNKSQSRNSNMTGGSSALSAPRITAQNALNNEDPDKLHVPKQVLRKKKKSKNINNN
jgi:hypothetical protein